MVFITDKRLIAQLPINAADWFENKQRLMARYNTQMGVTDLEIAPGQNVSIPTPITTKTTLIIYANLLSPQGQHRTVVKNKEVTHIHIEKDSYRLIYK